ncbi:MAG: hypothetical protein QOG50_3428 [Actinomycetota bacterium]|nr:hypothetical protein [Actinomycetota bacterium]
MRYKAAAIFAVLAIVIAGCSSSSPKASKPAASTSTTTATTTPKTAVRSGELQVIVGSATGSSPCEQAAPTPASPGQVGAGGGGSVDNVNVLSSEHGGRGMVKQLPLTHAQRVVLEMQMQQARAVVAKYPTTAAALADHYDKSTPYVPCIGAHYTKFSLAGSFDPSAPSELLYDGTAPDSKIVGLSYLVVHHNGPPPGFAGPNDHWHQHNANGGLCLKGAFVVGGEDVSPQQCADRGGRKVLLIDVWMMHAWVVPGFECSWGVFSGECPELGGRLGGNAWEAPEPAKS